MEPTIRNVVFMSLLWTILLTIPAFLLFLAR